MSDARSLKAWALAKSQHGIVARRQLLALGFSTTAIEHRLARGRLHLVMRGIYAVGWPGLTPRRRWMAAVLAGGEAAALSHRSAAALWGIASERPGRIDVSVRRRCELKRPGLLIRGRPALSADDFTFRDGIPLTVIALTVIDLATELSPLAVERAVNEADKHDLIGPERLRIDLERYAGIPGAPLVRRLLDKSTFLLSDSNLEIFFRPIAKAAGLAQPLSKQIVNGFEVDFFWPDLGLVVETDGLRFHRTPSAQARDARRDRAHVLAGMSPLRFTHYEIKHEPVVVKASLARFSASASDIDHT